MKVYQLIVELQELAKNGHSGATIRGPVKTTRSTGAYNNFQPIDRLVVLEEEKETSVILQFNNCMVEG